MRVTRLAAAALTGLATTISPACAGEPPFPSELMYPNVVFPSHQFGNYGAGLGQFSEPRSACWLDNKTILIAEAGNRRLQKVRLNGVGEESWSFAKYGDGFFVNLSSISCDKNHIIAADQGTNEILIFDTAGNFKFKFGQFGVGRGQLNSPAGLALDRDRIIVADTGNHRIQIFSLAGEFISAIGHFGDAPGEMKNPTSVALDRSSNIYVADSWNNRVQKFSPAGDLIGGWGEWGSHAGFFATPSSISVRGYHVYLTDLTNHRIQVFDLHGNYLFQWGRHPVYGHDGNGRTHYPWTLVVDESEERFALVEPVENRVQIFEREGLRHVTNINDSAWWDKATRFHYGSRSEVSGNLLTVSEPDTHSVLVFDITSDRPTLISRLGGRGSRLGQLIEPSGMAIDPARGEILVTDAGNLRLQTLSLVARPPAIAGLESLTSAGGWLNDLGRAVVARTTTFEIASLPDGTPLNQEKQGKFTDIKGARPVGFALLPAENLIYPGALKRANDGEVYLYDQAAARILIIRDNRVRVTFGGYGTEPGQFRSVHNMSFSKDQTKLFVVDPYNFRVQVFDRNGKFLYTFGKPGHSDDEFSHIFGITSGHDGFIYLTDEAKHCIYKYTESGNFVKRWSRWGTEPGELYKPKGISQDNRGRLYTLSFGNHRGEIYDTEGRHLGSFGLADPDTQRGRDLVDVLVSRSAYSLSAKSILDRDVTPLLNSSGVQVLSPHDIVANSNGGRFKLEISATNPINSSQITNDLTVVVRDGASGQIADVELTFDADMPAHGHGLRTRPQVVRTMPGTFEIRNVRLSMPGMWELYLDLRDRGSLERAQAAVFVR